MTLFERNKIIKTVEDVQRLAKRLSDCPGVTRFNEPGNDEPWGLADSLADLEGSMRIFLEAQLPRLVQQSLSPSETYDLLLDIAEEFRHILYHIHDPKFFRFVEPTHDWLTVPRRNDDRE